MITTKTQEGQKTCASPWLPLKAQEKKTNKYDRHAVKHLQPTGTALQAKSQFIGVWGKNKACNVYHPCRQIPSNVEDCKWKLTSWTPGMDDWVFIKCNRDSEAASVYRTRYTDPSHNTRKVLLQMPPEAFFTAPWRTLRKREEQRVMAHTAATSFTARTW